jgi:hypothetical protein
MFSEDLEPRRGMLSRLEHIYRHWGIIAERSRWCGRNCVTDRRRGWKTRRKQEDGGGIICYDKEVD